MVYKFGILKSEHENHHEYWVKSCENLDMNYKVIELTKNDWFENINDSSIDCFLASGAYDSNLFKQVFDERIYVLTQVLKKKMYPNFEEILIHENKKFFAYWVKGKDIPHPKTDIFYHKDEALKFLANTEFPIVAKTSIGDSGKGVSILKSLSQATDYVNKAFSSGIRRQFGPNMKQGDTFNRAKKVFSSIKDVRKKMKKYIERYSEAQKGFVIFYEYIPHDYEWRIIKIGESYFGHQKVKTGEMASGSKGIDYVNPPFEILDFVKDICEKSNCTSQAVDIFEGKNGEYLVNEMQTLFGHVQDFVLEVDGEMGRYKNIDGKWVFEEGDFNTNMSFDLRLKDAIKLLDENYQAFI